MVDPASEFDRGHLAGEIAARLAGHDQHFASINGSLADIANEMHALTLAVQRLGDQAEAAAKTVVTTAAALKAADDARRSRSDSSWSPWQKLLAAVGGLGVLVGIYLAIKRG